jgi:hypothetical protein
MLAVQPMGAIAAEPARLRVCADPNNLPFSNRAGEGFENKLAEMVAQQFGKVVVYTWWAQRRGFIRHTLKAGDCDLVMGVPAQYDLVETTRPYYRSTYAFISQTARHLQLHAIDDPQLRSLAIGVHLIGEDGNNTPPAHALGQAERLGDIVIGAGFEAQNGVRIGVVAGQHDDEARFAAGRRQRSCMGNSVDRRPCMWVSRVWVVTPEL